MPIDIHTNRKKSYIMLISALFIVGTIGIFRRYIPLSSALLAFFRGLIGAVSLSIFIALRHKGNWQDISRKKLFGLILNGAFLGINWILLFEAYNYTTIAKATLCYYLQPTIVLLLSPFVFQEKLTLKKLVCAIIALIGMVFVSGIINTNNPSIHDIKGMVFGLSAACFYSLVVIFNKKIDGIDAYEKTIIQLFSAAVILIPYLLLTEDFNSITFDTKLIILLLVVGIIHTGVVYALYFGSMNGLKGQTISILSYIDPVVALGVSTIILQEAITIEAMIGAIFIIGSALISEYEPKS